MNKEQLLSHIADKKTIWQISKEENLSRSTIRKRMKEFGIDTPKGFFYTGKKIGRPRGIPMMDWQKDKFREIFSGDRNPFWGKKHSKKTRKKMSKNHADFNGDKNPFVKWIADPKNRTRFVENIHKKWEGRDDDWRRRHSEILSLAIAKQKQDNPNNHKGYDCGLVTTKKGGVSWCRSSWEKKVCGYLDVMVEVVSFRLEPFCVKYVNKDGEKRSSRIDFLVDVSGCLVMIEVKPKALHKHAEYRISGYRKFCKENGMLFVIVGKEDVESLEVFKSFLMERINEHRNAKK